MQFRPLLRPILDDDGLTRHLGDAEARVLVEWLVERAELVAASASNPADVIARLCRRAKAIGLFVALWCYRDDRGAAGQLASAERFPWPLPAADVDPVSLMERILRAEDRRFANGARAA
jgi:hypothetical protein